MPLSRFAVILPAAGRSTRFGDPRTKKTFADLGGRAVWIRAADAFVLRDDVAQVIVAISADDRELFDRRHGAEAAFFGIRVVEGGAERADSIARALEAVDPSCDHVAVHDAARPCVTKALIDAVFAAAVEHGAAIPGVAVADTLKRVDPDGSIVATVDRAGLFSVQTPQAFRRDILERAYLEQRRTGAPSTDDATLVEAIGHVVKVVAGSPFNLKITTGDDLRLAQSILASAPTPTPGRPGHPFADESAASARDDLPRISPGDLFRD